MGWTNSVPIFHEDVTHILQPEIPHVTVPFIDDVPIKGPDSDYRQPDGSFEMIAENPGIHRFIWEHFQNVNRVVQRMKYSGGTFSGFKAILCAQEFNVVGHRCTPRGRILDDSFIAKISVWGPCRDLSDVHAFLGTVGVLHIFIRNLSHRAHALTMLTRKLQPFVFGADQLAVQEDLKQAVLILPALRPIDYTSVSPVILSVDTSHIAVGFILSQANTDDIKRRHFARFGSITLNDRESHFSQPKLEIYGLFRALHALKLYLIGVRNLTVEVDARCIKGMLSNPDIASSASINRWIISILVFHFTLVHVPGIVHGPDRLSRRPAQPGDTPEEDAGEEFDDWIDKFYGFTHTFYQSQSRHSFALFAVACHYFHCCASFK
jgi:RNase H-like domain found in reverse transcriptase